MRVQKATGFVAWCLRRSGFGGVCLPPFGIFILPERLHDVALIRHESAHRRQAVRMGAVMYYSSYFWFTIRYGYHRNPMEVEARAAERQP